MSELIASWHRQRLLDWTSLSRVHTCGQHTYKRPLASSVFLPKSLVKDMGNPWVFFTLSVPVSVHTHTHDAWVQVYTGFNMGVTILLHSQFHYSFPPLLYLYVDTFSLHSFPFWLLIHNYSCSAWLLIWLLMCLFMRSPAYWCAYTCTVLLTHMLTHYAYSAYSYTVVVQYIRTGWTPLFGS